MSYVTKYQWLEMPKEECDTCGSTVPLSSCVHVLLNTKTDEGVVDHYICRNCYDDEIAPVFE